MEDADLLWQPQKGKAQKEKTKTANKEDKTQKILAKQAGCSQRAECKHIDRKLTDRKGVIQHKLSLSRKLEIPIRNLGEHHTDGI